METQWRISVRRALGLPPRTRSILLPGLAGSLSFSHQHQRRVSQLLNTMMSSTNPAVQYIAWRSATNTTGALGRNRTYLCIHRNLSGDPALDGHDAEVNARITQIHELLRVRDGLDRICELTKDDTEEFLGHISTFWCVRWVGSWRCGCLFARFCCQNSKTGLRGGRASMTWPILNILIYFYVHGNVLIWLPGSCTEFYFFFHLICFSPCTFLCLSFTLYIVYHCYM